MSSVEDNDELSKPVVLFGRDIRTIPCFKQSMLNGIYGGIGAGLTSFIFTSRVRRSTNVALASYMGVATIYWCWCRYKYVRDKNTMLRLQQMIMNVDSETQRKNSENEGEELSKRSQV